MTAVHRCPLVVVTETEGPGARLAERLAAAGVRVWSFPVVAHEPVGDAGPLDAALERLEDYVWVVFTSVRAVEAVCTRDLWNRWPWAEGKHPWIAAVGPVTAGALRQRGLVVRQTPAAPGAAGLARALADAEGGDLAGRRILWPRSDIARDELRDTLAAAGAVVVDPVAYRTVARRPVDAEGCARAIAAGAIDAVTFLSPSSAVNFAAALGEPSLACLNGRTIVASVGPTTSAALADLGAPPAIEAPDRTTTGLVAALLARFGLRDGAAG
ncbi:MAG: uroporphyrinogen-III synthase [Acidobacteriota bacterium]